MAVEDVDRARLAADLDLITHRRPFLADQTDGAAVGVGDVDRALLDRNALRVVADLDGGHELVLGPVVFDDLFADAVDDPDEVAADSHPERGLGVEVLERRRRVPAGPAGIAVDGDGDVWVAGQDDGNVYEIKAGGDTATPLENFDGQAPFGMAVSGDFIWVVDRVGEEVIKYNWAEDKFVTSVEVGDNPKGVAVEQGTVYVANTDSGTVSLISEEGAAVRNEVDVGGQPRAIDVLDGHVWVSNGDSASLALDQKSGWVSIFDLSGNLVTKKLPVGGSPEGLGVSDDEVWVATGPEQLAVPITP